jgi:lysophospholipase L1-like esterase
MKRMLFVALYLISLNLDAVIAKDAPTEGQLPKVLIIGDSISLGYTPLVTQMLKEKAIVKHHRGNAQHTGTGLRLLDQWIGNTEWDVIHFNWGLWDLCYRHPQSRVQGRRDKVNGTVTTTLEQYEKNLDQLVARLKKTEAKLIWAHTTFVPEKEAGRFVGDDKKYNDAATRIMEKHGVTINDLHSLTKSFSSEFFTAPGNVHYTKNGSKAIAEQVAGKIMETLKGSRR